MKAFIYAALLGAAAATSLPAQTTGAAPGSGLGASADSAALSLDAAVARALDQSQEVRLARAQVDLARTQVTSARAQALPQINASLAYTRTIESPFNTGGGFTLPDSLRFSPDTLASLSERVSYLERQVPTAGLGGLGGLFGSLPFGQQNAYVAGLTGTQVLYAGGRVGAALRIAGEYRDAADAGFREQRSEVELRVRTAYHRAQLAQELESIAAAALEQAQRFLAQQQLRLRAGTASELEVLRADVAAANLRPQLVETRNAAELALLELKRLIDVPLTQPLRLTTPLAAPAPAAGAEPGPELAVSQRAAVDAAERRVAISEEQVAIARGSFLPQVNLQLNYGGQLFPTRPFEFGGTDWRRDVTATVAVQVPLFSGFRRTAELEQSRINLEQSRLQLAQLQEAVQLEYEQARGERERALSSISARQRTVDQAQRVYDLTVLRYERGLATQLEVSDARLALLQARTNVVQAIADYYIADAGVTRALGRPTGARARLAESQSPAAPATPSPAPSSAPSTTPPAAGAR